MRRLGVTTAAGQSCLIAFDRANPQAVRWAEDRAAFLVTEVGAETRAAIRQIIARSFTDGIPPRQAARLVRDVVGLRTDQVEAVLNLRRRLAEASARAQETGRSQVVRHGKTRIRVPPGGLGERLGGILGRYSEQLRRQRALLIARTETIAASVRGQQELWRQAVQNGQLRGDEMQEWTVAQDERLCPICEPLDGVRVALGELFSTDVGEIAGPPAHPACRCAVVLAPGTRRSR